MSLKDLYNWPKGAIEGRKTGEIFVIDRDHMLRTVHGDKHPMGVNFFISTDYGHMAEYRLPSGGNEPRVSDPIRHGSDALVYSLEGETTVLIRETEDTFVVHPNDGVFIPAETEYLLINYFGEPIRGLICIGPKL